MGPILYSLGIIFIILGIVGVVWFGTAERKRSYSTYGRASMWLLGAGVLLLIVGLVVASNLF